MSSAPCQSPAIFTSVVAWGDDSSACAVDGALARTPASTAKSGSDALPAVPAVPAQGPYVHFDFIDGLLLSSWVGSPPGGPAAPLFFSTEARGDARSHEISFCGARWPRSRVRAVIDELVGAREERHHLADRARRDLGRSAAVQV